jgi:hypothetical protein
VAADGPKNGHFASNAPGEAPERLPVIHSSLYLREPVYEALRKIGFDESTKIHDLVMEGIDAVLRRRGYPPIATLNSGRKR